MPTNERSGWGWGEAGWEDAWIGASKVASNGLGGCYRRLASGDVNAAACWVDGRICCASQGLCDRRGGRGRRRSARRARGGRVWVRWGRVRPDGGVELADVLVERADAVRVGAGHLGDIHPERFAVHAHARASGDGVTTRARPSPGRSGRAGKTRSDTARGARGSCRAGSWRARRRVSHGEPLGPGRYSSDICA